MRIAVVAAAALLGLCQFVLADTVILESGREVQCTVLQENDQGVTVTNGYGSILYPKGMVRSVKLAILTTYCEFS